MIIFLHFSVLYNSDEHPEFRPELKDKTPTSKPPKLKTPYVLWSEKRMAEYVERDAEVCTVLCQVTDSDSSLLESHFCVTLLDSSQEPQMIRLDSSQELQY